MSNFDMELIVDKRTNEWIKKKVIYKKTKTLKHSFNIFNCVNASTVVLLPN